MEEESPPPPLRRSTPDHPPYSEMVQCAIKALAEPHGSTEHSISSFIETHYDSLPWAHSKLLPYYLNKLILAGEISKSPCFPNCYVLPGTLVNPNPRNLSCDDLLRVHSPVKRGHRRPRKVIPPNAETMVNGGEDRAKLVVNPNPKLEIVVHDPAVKDGRGRPRKIVPHVDGEPNSESVQKGCGYGRGLIVNPSPNPNPEILCRGPAVKGARGRPRKITPCVDGEPISELVHKCGGNGRGLIVNPSPNPNTEILGYDPNIKRGRGRPRKITPNIDGEPKSRSLKQGSLNVNLNPSCLRVGSSVKCRGRPPKVAYLDFNGEANHDPDSLFSEHEFNCSWERPRLLLKLKRRKPEEIVGDGGDVTGGWMYLKEDAKEKELEGVKVEGNQEVLALQEKDLIAVEVDDHFEELLALQEKGLSDVKIDEHDDGFLALQEKDLDWMQIDGPNGDVLALQQNGSNEIKTDGQNEEMFGLEASGMNGITVDEHTEELLLPLQENGPNGIDRNNEELLTLQEKDLNAIKPDECNGDLLALEEKDLKDTEIVGHNEELLVSKAVFDAESCQSKSDQGSLHIRAKPKKTRRLWYEG